MKVMKERLRKIGRLFMFIRKIPKGLVVECPAKVRYDT